MRTILAVGILLCLALKIRAEGDGVVGQVGVDELKKNATGLIELHKTNEEESLRLFRAFSLYLEKLDPDTIEEYTWQYKYIEFCQNLVPDFRIYIQANRAEMSIERFQKYELRKRILNAGIAHAERANREFRYRLVKVFMRLYIQQYMRIDFREILMREHGQSAIDLLDTIQDELIVFSNQAIKKAESGKKADIQYLSSVIDKYLPTLLKLDSKKSLEMSKKALLLSLRSKKQVIPAEQRESFLSRQKRTYPGYRWITYKVLDAEELHPDHIARISHLIAYERQFSKLISYETVRTVSNNLGDLKGRSALHYQSSSIHKVLYSAQGASAFEQLTYALVLVGHIANYEGSVVDAIEILNDIERRHADKMDTLLLKAVRLSFMLQCMGSHEDFSYEKTVSAVADFYGNFPDVYDRAFLSAQIAQIDARVFCDPLLEKIAVTSLVEMMQQCGNVDLSASHKALAKIARISPHNEASVMYRKALETYHRFSGVEQASYTHGELLDALAMLFKMKDEDASEKMLKEQFSKLKGQGIKFLMLLLRYQKLDYADLLLSEEDMHRRILEDLTSKKVLKEDWGFYDRLLDESLLDFLRFNFLRFDPQDPVRAHLYELWSVHADSKSQKIQHSVSQYQRAISIAKLSFGRFKFTLGDQAAINLFNALVRESGMEFNNDYSCALSQELKSRSTYLLEIIKKNDKRAYLGQFDYSYWPIAFYYMHLLESCSPEIVGKELRELEVFMKNKHDMKYWSPKPLWTVGSSLQNSVFQALENKDRVALGELIEMLEPFVRYDLSHLSYPRAQHWTLCMALYCLSSANFDNGQSMVKLLKSSGKENRFGMDALSGLNFAFWNGESFMSDSFRESRMKWLKKYKEIIWGVNFDV